MASFLIDLSFRKGASKVSYLRPLGRVHSLKLNWTKCILLWALTLTGCCSQRSCHVRRTCSNWMTKVKQTWNPRCIRHEFESLHAKIWELSIWGSADVCGCLKTGFPLKPDRFLLHFKAAIGMNLSFCCPMVLLSQLNFLLSQVIVPSWFRLHKAK